MGRGFQFVGGLCFNRIRSAVKLRIPSLLVSLLIMGAVASRRRRRRRKAKIEPSNNRARKSAPGAIKLASKVPNNWLVAKDLSSC